MALPIPDHLFQHLTWPNASKGTALFLAAHMIQVGLWAYTSPKSLAATYGMPYDGSVYPESGPLDKKSSGKDEKVAHEIYWPLLFAPREVAFGGMILTFAGLRQWKAVGIVVGFTAGLLATTDGVVGGIWGKGRWREAVKSHGVPAVILSFVSYGLLNIQE